MFDFFVELFLGDKSPLAPPLGKEGSCRGYGKGEEFCGLYRSTSLYSLRWLVRLLSKLNCLFFSALPNFSKLVFVS